MPGHGVQAVIRQSGESASRKLQCTDVRVGERHAEPSEFVRQKGEVKAGIVGHQHAHANKVAKCGIDIFRQGPARKHVVCDAVHAGGLPWYRPRHPDQDLEFSHNLAMRNGNRSQLDNPIPPVG
jgi:hypothetical protein